MLLHLPWNEKGTLLSTAGERVLCLRTDCVYSTVLASRRICASETEGSGTGSPHADGCHLHNLTA